MTQFKSDDTRKEKFHVNANKDVEVDMMTLKAHFHCFDDAKCQVRLTIVEGRHSPTIGDVTAW